MAPESAFRCHFSQLWSVPVGPESFSSETYHLRSSSVCKCTPSPEAPEWVFWGMTFVLALNEGLMKRQWFYSKTCSVSAGCPLDIIKRTVWFKIWACNPQSSNVVLVCLEAVALRHSAWTHVQPRWDHGGAMRPSSKRHLIRQLPTLRDHERWQRKPLRLPAAIVLLFFGEGRKSTSENHLFVRRCSAKFGRLSSMRHRFQLFCTKAGHYPSISLPEVLEILAKIPSSFH